MTQPSDDGFSNLIQLEQDIRDANTLSTFRFTIVNNTAKLVKYRQAALIARRQDGALDIQSLSNVATVDPHAPFVRWLTSLATHIQKQENGQSAQAISRAQLETVIDQESMRQGLDEWNIQNLLWLPLLTNDNRFLGVLILLHPEPWDDNDLVLAEHVAGVCAHAWAALLPKSGHDKLWHRKALWGVAVLACLAVLAIPVRQSTLAPATVVPKNPAIITAPIQGTVETVHVRPNSSVKEKDLLITFDDTQLRNQRDITQRILAVAKAEYLRAAQGAFNDAESKAKLSVLKADIQLRQAELIYTQEQLVKIHIQAPRDGVVIFRDADDWTGKPVQIGERIMIIAQPENIELSIDLGVADAINFPQNAPVRLFLNTDPTQPIDAILTRSNYQAELTAQGQLAYPLLAQISPQQDPPRLGMKGTARILSNKVPLGYYLFRRPLAFLRSTLGL